MLLEYIQAAMEQAEYVPSDVDGRWSGRIAGFGLAPVSAITPEAGRYKLQLALEEWLLSRISLNLPLPDAGSITLAVGEMEEKLKLVRLLKQDIAATKAVSPVTPHLKNWANFVLSNWSFVGSILAIILAATVYYYYGVNTYLENILTLHNNKETAKKYSQLGDKLMEHGEWEAAEDAYNTAQKLDQNNTDAISASYIISLYKPAAGTFSVEALDARLQSTRKVIENDPYLRKYMYLIYYFEGVRYDQKGDGDAAVASLEQSLQVNPKFIAGYTALADLITPRQGVDGAIPLLNKALELYEGSVIAQNNLGARLIVKEDFANAITDRALNRQSDQGLFVTASEILRRPRKELRLHIAQVLRVCQRCVPGRPSFCQELVGGFSAGGCLTLQLAIGDTNQLLSEHTDLRVPRKRCQDGNQLIQRQYRVL